jgi:hypothetical protein
LSDAGVEFFDIVRIETRYEYCSEMLPSIDGGFVRVPDWQLGSPLVHYSVTPGPNSCPT